MSTYANPGAVLTVGVAFPLLSTIAVGFRLWARRVQKMPLLIDDYLIFFALANTIGLGICIIIGVSGKAFAYHTPAPDTEDPDGYLYAESPEQALASKLIYALQPLGTFAFGCTKLSIVYFYRRLFCTNRAASSFLSKATWAAIYFLYVWILAFLIGFIFDCGIEWWSNWGPLINNSGYCNSTYGLTATFTISDVLSDFVVILLPIRTIWKLQMSLAQKIAITCIFVLGTLTIVTSALRLILFAIWYFAGTEYLRDIDIVYTQMIFWITITSSLGIVTACLPTVQVLVRKLPLERLQKSLSSLTSSWRKGSVSTSWPRFNTNSTSSILPSNHGPWSGLESSKMDQHHLSNLETSPRRCSISGSTRQ